MKKILFIHPFLPYPLLSGGHQALFNGIKSVKDNYDVYLTYMAKEGETHDELKAQFQEAMPGVSLLPYLEKEGKLYNLRHSLSWKLHRLVDLIFGMDNKEGRKEYKTADWKDTVTPNNIGWVNHLHDIFQNNHFDIVQVEMPWMISTVFSLPTDVLKIYVHHELGFVRRSLEIESMEKSAYTEVCRKYTDFNELSQLNLYDSIITLSSIDKDKLLQAGVSAPIHSSFAIVDTIHKLHLPQHSGKRLVFVGSDTHAPNLMGVRWFLDNCWKQLKDHDKDYCLDIIGKWDNENIESIRKQYADVHFLGFVDNLQENCKGSIMIVPIMVGSGIRMKILEACSMGLPFVSTSVGAEGIPVKNGTHCYITDDPAEFVRSIISLEDVSLQHQFVKASYDMVVDNYSLDALRRNRLSIYNNVN